MPHLTHHDRPATWHLSLPGSLALQVEARLIDPMTGSVKWGARTQLMQSLLRKWLADQSTTAPHAAEPILD